MNNPRLKNKYLNDIIPDIMKKFNFTNKHQVCKIEKIVLSKGLGKKDDVNKAVENLSNIACQHAISIKAKKSVSQFSIREGQINGAKVTLRNNMLYFFLEKLVNVGFVLDREFKGVKIQSFNKQKSNITVSLGITDERVFPEIGASSMKKEGFNVTIVTNARTVQEAAYLINAFDIPVIGLEKSMNKNEEK